MMRYAAQIISFILLLSLLVPHTHAQSIQVAGPQISISDTRVTTEANTAILSWKTNDPARTIVSYQDTSGVWHRTDWTESLRTQHSATLQDLQPGTSYTFEIVAENVYGNQAVQRDVFVTQAMTAPAATTQQTQPVVLGEQSTNSTQQLVQYVPIAGTATTAGTVSGTLSSFTTSDILLILGGLILGALLVIVYQLSPHKLQIRFVSKKQPTEEKGSTHQRVVVSTPGSMNYVNAKRLPMRETNYYEQPEEELTPEEPKTTAKKVAQKKTDPSLVRSLPQAKEPQPNRFMFKVQ